MDEGLSREIFTSMPLSPVVVKDFVRQSNAIESINRVKASDVDAHLIFLSKEDIRPSDMIQLVGILQPGARLRDKLKMNAVIGPVDNPVYIPPPGGPEVARALDGILQDVALLQTDPYEIHCRYESLHPFTDGNGRSGRALWLWQMVKMGLFVQGRGFLHHWYYESLRRHDSRMGR